MLTDLGHDVRVLEQSATALRSDYAAGMSIGPNGSRFFTDYDQNEKGLYFPSKGFFFLDKMGSVADHRSVSLFLTGWHVLYQRLRAMLDSLDRSDTATPNTHAEVAERGKVLFDLSKRVTGAAVSTNGIVSVEWESQLQEDVKVGETAGALQADFVIDASGANSALLKQLRPGLTKEYAGFVGWRGTVHESEVSQRTRELFHNEKYPVNVAGSRGYTYALGYAIPSEDGNTKPGSQLLNAVFYDSIPEGSDLYNTVMTDSGGHLHRGTLPIGKMSLETRQILRDRAKALLDPAFAEIFHTTKEPFISTVRDRFNPSLRALNERLIFVGEAATLMRPTGGKAFDMCAQQALTLRRVMQGEITLMEWEAAVKASRMHAYYFSRQISDRYLSPRWRYWITVVQFAVVEWWQRVSTWWTAAKV